MAKRDDKKKRSNPPSRADAVRAAVDQAFQATAGQAEGTQRRVQELAEELSSVAGRLRETLEGSRPVTAADLDVLRGEIAGLTGRVQALEKGAGAGRPAPGRAAAKAATPAARRASAAKPAPARKPSAKPAKVRPAAGPAARKPASRGATPASRVPAVRAAARRSAAKRPS